VRVYEFAAPEGYEMVTPEADEAFDVIRRLDGTSKKNSWTPFKVRLVTVDDKARPLSESDFLELAANAPVLRQRAVDAVGHLLQSEAELLPLWCDTASLWLLNVLNVVDAFDVERSDYAVFPNTKRIFHVRKYAFIADRLEGVGVFRAPQLLTYSVYLTDQVVEAVEHSGLKGARFRPIWQSDAMNPSVPG
jgi:hypothetical protein